MSNIYSKLISRIGGAGRAKARVSDGPRSLISFADAYIVDHFGRLGYAVDYNQLAFTIESVEAFVEAREKLWHKPGHVALHEAAGILIIEDAQPHPQQPTRDIAVVSLGDARVVMGVIERTGRTRYAATM